jgi:uncharacterized iron-regulated membrane protein
VSRYTHWRGITFAVVVLVMGTPQAAWACAVCNAGQVESSRLAFILMTAMLSLLPFFLVGSVIWWLRRRARELNALESAAHQALEQPKGSPINAPEAQRGRTA